MSPMTHLADAVLLLLVMLDLFILASGRVIACIRACALQGLLLALLPPLIASASSDVSSVHVMSISAGTLLLKAIVIPWLLRRAAHRSGVRRETEPFVSMHRSVLVGALLVGISFWLSGQLVLPAARPPSLLVPIALATILIGFLVIVSRRKAITQVVGYLVLENGIFLFGLVLAGQMPVVVELGILLDVFVGAFVFGIVIDQISAEFDSIDTDVLSELKD